MSDESKSGGPEKHSYSLRRLLAASALGFASVVLLGLVPSPPETFGQWMLLLLGALLAIVATTAVVTPPWSAADMPVPRIGRLNRKVLLSVTVGVVAVLTAVFIGPFLLGLAKVAAWGCAQPVELTVLTSPTGLNQAEYLSARFEESTADKNHGCPTANLHVYARSEGEVGKALASGWATTVDETEPLRDIGPRPDIWLPLSSARVSILRDQAVEDIIERDTLIGSSPLVLGITGPATGLERQGMSWADLFEGVTESGRGVVRADPASSVASMISTAILYGADLDGAGPWERVRGVELGPPAIEQQMALSRDRHQYPLGDDAALLCGHRQVPEEQRPAVIISEQDLVRFNRGELAGAECGQVRTKGTMQAFYPLDSVSLDHRFVQFRWSEPEQTDQADDFVDWLVTAEGNDAILRMALRPPGTDPAVLLDESNGALPDVDVPLAELSSQVLNQTLDQRKEVQKGTRVLLALDASGSMGAPATGDSGTRFDAIAEGIQQALALPGSVNEVGLWLFSGEPADIRRAVPIGPLEQNQTRIGEVLDQATPAGDTPLHQTIVDGAREIGMGTDLPDTRTAALVVLTDGEDTSSRLLPQQVVDQVTPGRVRIYLVAVGDTTCAAAPLQTVADATGGQCYNSGLESVGDRLRKIFAMLLGG